MYLKELDSIASLSFDGNFLVGAGLSRGGSDIITEEGDKIKAGKFSVLFYVNNHEAQKLHNYKVSKRNEKLLSKYRGRDLKNTVSGSRSVSTQGNNNSD